ncbi:hypothetical protein V492_01347 [Pseudogymnoascus sp. VKM F-4246]|nr:hypothetical protein V492_01347 [Pseudogymnoascus sp. VKM F-4246]
MVVFCISNPLAPFDMPCKRAAPLPVQGGRRWVAARPRRREPKVVVRVVGRAADEVVGGGVFGGSAVPVAMAILENTGRSILYMCSRLTAAAARLQYVDGAKKESSAGLSQDKVQLVARRRKFSWCHRRINLSWDKVRGLMRHVCCAGLCCSADVGCTMGWDWALLGYEDTVQNVMEVGVAGLGRCGAECVAAGLDTIKKMLFAALLPFFAAIVPLATAQESTRAVFVSRSGEEFEINTADCVNFKITQPIYETLFVADGNKCTLFGSKDCSGNDTHEFGRGAHFVGPLHGRWGGTSKGDGKELQQPLPTSACPS